MIKEFDFDESEDEEIDTQMSKPSNHLSTLLADIGAGGG